jgi:hypothetical protein
MRAAAEQLASSAAQSALPVLKAQAAFARGRVAARSDPASGVVELERGLRDLPAEDWPGLRAALHLDLARALGKLNRAAAVAEARAALAIYERFGRRRWRTPRRSCAASGSPSVSMRAALPPRS